MLKYLAIFVIVAVGVIGAPNQPNKGGATDDKPRVTRPQDEEQNSQRTPSVVVQVSPQQTNPSDADEEKDIQAKLAFYTLLLAVFTAVLAAVSIAQGYFLHIHGVELRTLAGAAKENAEATKETLLEIKRQADLMNKSLILQFRPKILIRGGFIDGTRLADTGEIIGGRLQFIVTNAGGTTATIYKSEFVVKTIGSSPTQTNLFDGATSLGEFSLATGQGTTVAIPISFEVIKNIRNEFDKRNEPLSVDRIPVYFIGDIWYRDDLGISRNTGVFRRFDPNEQTFMPVEKSSSEYAD
jgi:hypothetical protein